jgi:acyl transferase domain-containing protein
LQAWLQDEAGPGVYRGQLSSHRQELSLLSRDEEIKESIVAQYLAAGKLSKLMALWVKGVELDWNRLYGPRKPRRIQLPVYEFAKERYWIEAPEPQPAAVAAALHPLLHRNTSDLNQQSYTSTFDGTEHFLAHHRVRMQEGVLHRVLPGVAYLEMARAAIQQAMPRAARMLASTTLELHNVVWIKPIVVAEPTQVSIALSANEMDSPADPQLDYEIYTQDAEQEIIHCQGRARFSRQAVPARLDLERLQAQLQRGRWEAAALYESFGRMGLSYGAAHRGITALELGEQQLLARLQLSEDVAAQGMYVLHPGLMDSALQASIALLFELSDPPAKPPVPFAIEAVRVVRACSSDMLAWVRHAPGSTAGDPVAKLDIDLCDQRGNVCVQMRGFSARMLDEAAAMQQQLRRDGAGDGAVIAEADRSQFDAAFYQKLIDSVSNQELSVEAAAQFG